MMPGNGRGRGRGPSRAAQLELLLSKLQVDTSDRERKGITIALKPSDTEPRAVQTKNSISTSNSKSEFGIRNSEFTFPPPAPAPVSYAGIRVVNGKVIREGRHADSQWKFTGLAGAVPRRIYDYDPDVVLERRTDQDGIVRLLPVGDSPGESLRTLEYVVVDVETTGVGYAHRITEVAIVRLSGAGRVLEEYSTLVNPERPIPAMITELTHISGDMVRTAPSFREIAGDVHERLSGRIFVAHNAGFDWRFLSKELHMALGTPLRGRLLCTVRMARKLVPEMPRRSLDALSWYFGVSNDARHRAFGDARATAEVFRRMLERADEQSIVGWNELQKVLYARAARRKRRSTPTTFDPLA
jgi:DNA polymerase III epsilon subunit family exonuclease